MYGKIAIKTAAILAALTMTAVSGTVPTAAEPTAIKLMCLGDSITDGFWMTGGYRNTLCSLITEHGQESYVDFVGPNWGGSGYDPQHAGYSGYSVDNIAQEDSISGARTGLSSFIDWLMCEHPADVVFLQIGTNDILSLYDLEHYGERLEGLVDSILATLPETGMLYLATLPCMDANDATYISSYHFTVESMDAAVEQCNTQIRTLVEKKQAEGKSIQLAEINQVLTKSDLYDGVHPIETGYAKMGQFWYNTLCGYWDIATDPISVTGDVNGDGTVSIADVVTLIQHLTDTTELDAESAKRADLDGNGSLNGKDLTALKNTLL